MYYKRLHLSRGESQTFTFCLKKYLLDIYCNILYFPFKKERKMENGKTKVRSIRFPLELWGRLQGYATKNYTTVVAVIMRAIVEFLEREDRESSKKQTPETVK